jgi:phage gp46-like protein
MPHNLLRRTKRLKSCSKKSKLYIKTELDPIAEDFINDIKAVRPGVDASVLKEEHGTLKSH